MSFFKGLTMRTETRTIYTFSELPTERAKERARDWWRSNLDFSWGDESLESIKTFCAHFGVTLEEWSAGPHAPYSFKTNAENKHFRGRKLKDFNRDNMPTGYCLDCDLWMTFYDDFKRTGNALEAFDAALHAGFKSWRADMEYQMEDEHIDEVLGINGYEFDEDGGIV
jgi:hypothetical protein